VRGNKRLP